MPTTIFRRDEFGETCRQATPEEEAKFEQYRKEALNDNVQLAVEKIAAHKHNAKFLKRLKEKGLIQKKTRSSFGWQSREQKARSPVVFQEVDFNTYCLGCKSNDWKRREDNQVYCNKCGRQRPETWDYVSHGESGLWRLQPRFRYVDVYKYEVWISLKRNGRERLTRKGKEFSRDCNDKQCGKLVCASCWAIKYLPVGPDETIKVKQVLSDRIKVVDAATAGISPTGTHDSSRQELGEDQKGQFSLTSTQGEYKKGSGNRFK